MLVVVGGDGGETELSGQRKMRLDLKKTRVRVKREQEWKEQETAGMKDVVIAMADFVAVGTVVVVIEVDEIEHALHCDLRLTR